MGLKCHRARGPRSAIARTFFRRPANGPDYDRHHRPLDTELHAHGIGVQGGGDSALIRHPIRKWKVGGCALRIRRRTRASPPIRGFRRERAGLTFLWLAGSPAVLGVESL